MDKSLNFKEKIIKEIEDSFKDVVLFPEYKDLMLSLIFLYAYTGQCNLMFCNSFIEESLQLLKNALILYKNGFFDCVFYSIRQSSEVMDNMLYLAKSPNNKLKEWRRKDYFPIESKVKKQLENISIDYKEIKTLLSEYFNYHENLIKQSHKIIHKQGYDTFYNLRKPLHLDISGFSQQQETLLFLNTLKHTIGKLFILIVILDPMCLALADESVDSKIHMNLMSEPIDINFFNNILGLDDVIEKIKNSNFYKNFILYFEEKEEMLPATYAVIREMFWNIDALDEIESQVHLLSFDEKYMFDILKAGIEVLTFYFANGIGCYFTSNTQFGPSFSINTLEFQNYSQAKKPFNQKRNGNYISVIKKHDDDFLFIEHSEKFNNKDIAKLLDIEKRYLEQALMSEKELEFISSSIQ